MSVADIISPPIYPYIGPSVHSWPATFNSLNLNHLRIIASLNCLFFFLCWCLSQVGVSSCDWHRFAIVSVYLQKCQRLRIEIELPYVRTIDTVGPAPISTAHKPLQPSDSPSSIHPSIHPSDCNSEFYILLFITNQFRIKTEIHPTIASSLQSSTLSWKKNSNWIHDRLWVYIRKLIFKWKRLIIIKYKHKLVIVVDHLG